MAGFVFQLEPVLRQRLVAEDHEQRELAKILRKRMILMDQLRGMQQTITDSKHDLGRSLVGRVDLSAVGRFAQYSGQVELRARQIVRELAGIEQQVQQQQAKLAEAVKARRALELLKDRRLTAWRQRQERLETAREDENASIRYALAQQGVA